MGISCQSLKMRMLDQQINEFMLLSLTLCVLQISEVVLTIQTGSRGTQACINAAGMIDGVVADLETTVLFASAGTLNPEPGETFANHR